MTFLFNLIVVFLAFAAYPLQDFELNSFSAPDYQSIINATIVKPISFERIFENEIIGPEAFAFSKEFVFTGLADGRILRIPIASLINDSQIASPSLFVQLHNLTELKCKCNCDHIERFKFGFSQGN
jgi:hypothetical protein